MKYVLNLPLALAALFQAWFTAVVTMSGPWAGWEDGPSRGAMALVMLEPVVLCWALLLLAMVGAAFTEAFDWLPITRRWLRRIAVIAASLLIAALGFTCVSAAIEGSAAVGGRGAGHLVGLLLPVATLVAVVLPFVLAAWLAWMIDLPPPRRDALAVRATGLGALALLVLVGGPLGIGMLADEIRSERATAARDRHMIDEREAERTAEFAQLTDASPLHRWGGYATDELDRRERREAALRRLAARPTLEPDLAKDLVATYAPDSDIALILAARVEFRPSAALEAPLRTAMARVAAEIRRVGPGNTWPGDAETLDSYIRTDFAERLTASLVVARRMADTAGVDLRDALHDLQNAAVTAYPKTKTADDYRRDVAAADDDIATALARRQTR
ncbi:MAG: hypothetical protein ACM3JG_13285 [Thiohalocapsa sp.]